MQDNDFKKIYKQNFNKIMFYAYYYLNNWYEAENVAQETFVVLWNNRNKLDKKAEILPYLTVIARNACMSLYDIDCVDNDDTVKLLAASKKKSSLIKLINIFYNAKEKVMQNVNMNLLVTWLCAQLRRL